MATPSSWKISPGASLGPLVLGLSLPEIIKTITSHKLLHETKADFKYSSVNPLLFDYIIDLLNPIPSSANVQNNPSHARKPLKREQVKGKESSRPTIRLRFDSASQQLKIISIDNLSSIVLSYRGTDFSSPSRIPNMKTILDILGPTKPGRLSGGVYELHYPGISMEFAISKEYHSKLKDNHDLPPNIPAPLIRVFIFRGDDSKNPKILRCPPEKDSQNRRGSFSTVREESVLSEKPKPPTVVTFQQGISSVQTGTYHGNNSPSDYLYQHNGNQPDPHGHLQNIATLTNSSNYYHHCDDFVQLIVDADSTINFCRLQKSLAFGNSCQDVMGILGKPEGIYFKEKGRLAIHNSEKEHDLTEQMSPLQMSGSDEIDTYSAIKNYDYFYNYYSAGLDILFDGKSHVVKKFVLHTNFPGHVDFNIYHKCFFRLEVPTERDLKKLELDIEEEEPVGDLLGYPEFAPVKKSMKKKKLASLLELSVITPDMRWEDIQRELGIRSKEKTGPLINSRVWDHANNQMNPFESTRLYGYYNLIFDVMHNDHLASVTIFDPSAS